MFYCTMKNLLSRKNPQLYLITGEQLTTILMGYVFISDNNTGIDLYCCHTNPCKDSANHTRLNIMP